MGLRFIIAARSGLLHRWRCRLYDRKGRRRSSAWVGRYGELLAASWLRSRGVKVLRANFRLGGSGEVDLVCREGDVLLFVEVKARTRTDYGAPARAVDAAKRRLLREGAGHWLFFLERKVPFRFDVVEVVLYDGEVPEVSRIEGAFEMEEGAGKGFV